mmetsp:Transcript_119479/g.300326  ORF Transcript_119479/g.300326 Transcript_119479/m.300326 type:complete len:218 (+) Transcript_119479:1606-2259(+)
MPPLSRRKLPGGECGVCVLPVQALQILPTNAAVCRIILEKDLGMFVFIKWRAVQCLIGRPEVPHQLLRLNEVFTSPTRCNCRKAYTHNVVGHDHATDDVVIGVAIHSPLPNLHGKHVCNGGNACHQLNPCSPLASKEHGVPLPMHHMHVRLCSQREDIPSHSLSRLHGEDVQITIQAAIDAVHQVSLLKVPVGFQFLPLLLCEAVALLDDELVDVAV